MTQDMKRMMTTKRQDMKMYCVRKVRALLSLSFLLLLLILTLGTGTTWGQTVDYSGTYYIASYAHHPNTSNPATYFYDPTDPTNTNNYYLCPSDGWIYYKKNNNWTADKASSDGPFLTTFKCRTNDYVAKGGMNNAKWVITKHGNYYTFYHTGTSKYLVLSSQISGCGADRMRVHLEAIDSPETDDNALFTIASDGNPGFYIAPKTIAGDRLTVNGGNKNFLTGQKDKTGGPTGYTNTAGIVGIYRGTGVDDNRYFYLEDYITRPTITFNDATEEITITAVQLGVNLIYTTDGSTPSTSNPNAKTITGTEGNTTTVTFNPSDGETTIKAVAVVGSELSNIATYTTPVYIGENHKYLIQSQNNGWTIDENTTDFHFYMIPGDEEGEEGSKITKVNTTSLFRPSMEWHFLNAGIEDGVQYYYIVNNSAKDNSNNPYYLCWDGTNVCMLAFDSNDANKFKFKIVESVNAGSFNIIPYELRTASGNTNRFVYKQNDGNNTCNANAKVISLNNNSSNANSQWKFIVSSTLDTTAPFKVSSSSTESSSYTYYKLRSSGDEYYIKAPASTDANATMVVAASADETTYWYLEEAAAATDADWLTYYYIRNAQTGDYLYYANENPSNNAAAFKTSTTNDDAERYQFAWAHSTAKDYYFIVPKMLLNQTLNNFSTMNRYSAVLRVQKVRATGSSAWFFSEVPSFHCAQPIITWSADDNGYVITKSEPDAKIYYTLSSEGELTPSSGTLYTGAISVAELSESSVTIRAIVARSSDGSDASTVSSVTVSKVETPNITLSDGKVEITCATDGARIYYEMGTTAEGVSTPTTSSTLYNGFIEDAAGKYIKAIAVKGGWINSSVAASAQIVFPCGTPVIRKTSATTFTITCSFPTSGVTIRYNKDNNPADPTSTTGTIYNGAVTFGLDELPFTVKAIAVADGYNDSEIATLEITESLTLDDDDYFIIASDDDFNKFITMVNGADPDKKYKITNDINATGSSVISTAFTGELMGVAKADGTFPVISYLRHPIFNTINGGIVKNVILDNVSISGSGNVGAICNEATGDTRIYNCGVLATESTVAKDDNGYDKITSCSSTISGSGYVGGIVGLLDGSSRVINCFSYANITGGNLVGGIVGKNAVATNANATDTDHYLKTMVMNCMFYGDITRGSNKAPIYNGEIISNVGDYGVSNFNYFCAEASYVKDKNIDTYNCALLAETRYLQRFEFFRHILNGHRELAAWWATGDAGNKDEMMKWVLEPSQIGTTTPYPILKTPGKYPSVVNIDAANATTQTERNKGGLLGTLSVTIQMGDGAEFNHPDNASINNSSLTLNITDKDPDHYNFNYGKVQLPYYNDVGTHNYTGYRVVTGWKIVNITGGTAGSFTTGSDATANTNGEITAAPYNFADRHCTNKDLYSVGGRIFNQGAYWDVPEGVTAITIEPYWAQAAYCADNYRDVVYDQGMGTKIYVGTAIFTNGSTRNINGSSQKVYSAIVNARNDLSKVGNVYDHAVVLVGNVHQIGLSSEDSDRPYTIMSADLDNDNEPDYSYILRFDSRKRVHPVRVDFLNIIGLGMAQKSNGGTGTYNLGIMQPLGWFESTNTSLFRFTQFEYDKKDRVNSPMILQGGVIEQWVTTGQREEKWKEGKTVTYYHVGGNVWFKEFHIGVHQDKIQDEFVSPHPPISVTGGDFNEFYLTGYYNSPNANYDDNAECYINGGRFGKVSGTGMQGIGVAANNTGNIIWQIDNADIDEFYAGGINAAHKAEGNITTVISNSRVDQFCGGPKFGDMNSDKKVFTTATNCTFRAFFGAGYGGNSYNRYYPMNKDNLTSDPDWNGWVSTEYTKDYNSTYGGVSTRIDYQYIPQSDNAKHVARLFVDFISFSLATTYDVTSKLTGCTITRSPLGRLDLFSECIGNFYGGGSLGKVAGPVKSTLTNCTVEGNVFGAGYSATLPTVAVMNNSFQTEPRYDGNLGVYFPPVYPTTVPYTWKHRDEAEPVNSTERAIDTTNRILYTNMDLSPTNLGSVSGAVTLTITTSGDNGRTIIGTAGNPATGNVYGGGDASTVNNDTNPAAAYTNVTIKGNTTVHNNVFGGGNKGIVSGGATVNIEE